MQEVHQVRGRTFNKDDVFFDETESRRTQKLAYDTMMMSNMKKSMSSSMLNSVNLDSNCIDCADTLQSNEVALDNATIDSSSSLNGLRKGTIKKKSAHFDFKVEPQIASYTKPQPFFSSERDPNINRECIGTAAYYPSTPCIQGVDRFVRPRNITKSNSRPSRLTINLIKAELQPHLSPRGVGDKQQKRLKHTALTDPSHMYSSPVGINKVAELELELAESDFQMDLQGIKAKLSKIKKKKAKSIPALHPDVIEWHETAFRGSARDNLNSHAFLWNEYNCRVPELKGRSGWLANASDEYSPFHGRIPR